MKHLYKRKLSRGVAHGFYERKIECGIKFKKDGDYIDAAWAGGCLDCLKGRLEYWKKVKDLKRRKNNVDNVIKLINNLQKKIFDNDFNQMVDE